MPILKHEHKKYCDRNDYTEWLCHIAPDVLWYFIQDWGSYSGQVYGVGQYKNQILVYTDYYGSCSGCGMWGSYYEEDYQHFDPGGEPQSQEDVLNNSKLFTDVNEAKKYLKEHDPIYGDEKPDYESFDNALDEITKILNQ